MTAPASTADYRQAIRARAEDATGAGELEDPDARAAVDNPVCGDRVAVDIKMAGEAIEVLAHNVRGCVLCEAAASVVGAHAPGSTRADIEAVYTAVAAMLDGSADAPDGKWTEISMFAPVRDQPHRRHCVLLPFEALIRALDAASIDK